MVEEYKIAIKAALDAGEQIMKIYENKDYKVIEKEDNSPLTIADEKSNSIITNSLNATGIPIISEENRQLPYNDRKKWNRCWIVDPLDGTKEFIKGNGEFTVNIALIEKNTPLFGVIYVPVTKELYFGNVEESKSYKVQVSDDFSEETIEKAKEIKPASMENKIRVVGSRSHMNDETVDFIEHLKGKYNKEVEIVSKGSSLKLCLVAEGKADVYPRLAPTMEWDTAAGQAICKAVGLSVVDQDTGKEMVYNRENLLNNKFLVSNID